MAIKKRPISPRQKMINLMYVVLMALLALNVSTEVLNGFSLVEESLKRTTLNATKENLAIYDNFAVQMKKNPQKVKQWYDKSQKVKEMSNKLYDLADELKLAIVKEADGEDGDVRNIRNKEDLEAASQVMLAPGRGRGKELYDAINAYRNAMLGMVTDYKQKKLIASNLTTEIPKNAMAMGKNWQEYMFESMPTAAAVTLLSKLQNDVRYAEGAVLHTLVSNIDVKDIRVNALNAFVIPNAQTVVRGDKFSARIVMAAVDTTQAPQIFIGGKEMNLTDGLYETIAGRTGDFTLEGYIQVQNGNGELIKRNFSQKYSVVDPSATVTLQPVGPGKYIARPSTAGQNVTITVTSTNTGRPQQMGSVTFRVRRLPDPTPYINVKDENGADRFKSGGLTKAQLLAADGIGAAIDDGILDVPFHVQSFEAVFFDNMGNAVPMVSDGAHFSARQKETFRKLQRNRRFYISRVTATGPDGTARKLKASMEVIVK